LIIESIRIYGFDVYYCPRTIIDEDTIFNEDRISEYRDAYLIEMYIKNVEGFEGEGDFLSKFNIQIRDEITFTLAQRVYQDEIGANEVNTRPREGDLIYFPLTEKVYVVKFVEHEAVFYQLGGLQTCDLRCELFEYSNEDLNTGVAQIDNLELKHSMNVGINDLATLDEFGNIVINANTGRPMGLPEDYTSMDPFADNKEIQDKSDTFLDFSERDPFSESGQF
jgi:hypothetical protein